MARSPKSRFIPEQALTADQKKSCLAGPALERRIEASAAALQKQEQEHLPYVFLVN